MTVPPIDKPFRIPSTYIFAFTLHSFKLNGNSGIPTNIVLGSDMVCRWMRLLFQNSINLVSHVMDESTKICRNCFDLIASDTSKCPNCGNFDFDVEFSPLGHQVFEDIEQSAVDQLHFN